MKIRNIIGRFFPSVIVIVVALSIILGLVIQRLSLSVWMDFVERELESDFKFKVISEQEKAKIVVDTLLKDKNIVEAFESKNRQKLIELVMPYFEIYKDAGFYQIHFHDENLKSFLRTSNLEKYGDDLSSFRKDVVYVRENKKPVYSMNVGVMGPMIRYVAPVIVNEKYVGSIEANVKLEKNFAQKFSGDVILKVFFDEKGNRIDSLLKSNEKIEDFTNLFNEQKILQGKVDRFVRGKFVYISFPIKDYEGKVFSAFYRKIDASEIANYTISSVILQLSVVILLLIIVMLISIRTNKTFEKRIGHLLNEVSKLANGNFELELDINGDDEISFISKSFLSAVEKLKAILQEITQVTTETVKGVSNLSSITENTISAVSSISEIKSLGENTEKASVELDKSVEEFAAYLEESRAEIEMTLQKIKDFTDTIEEITKSNSNLINLVEVLTNLAEKITEIADNITVLAINASIETSKQNIDRDGLSRIAEMIMELSNSSRTLAKESKVSLNNIEKTVTSTILVTEKIGKDLSDVRESMNVIGEITEAFTRNVDKLVNISRMSHNSVEELYAGVEQLEEAIINIKEQMEKITNAFKEVAEAFKKLNV
uniref:Methyl-accepting chemotaxis protein n=1 Tax=Fervidobacterium nodosum TaxID=2424 RepID=A0A7C5U8B9_9BACT